MFNVDASILITANVPSAKKIIIYGPQEPDDGAIPSQFPISEDVQFGQLLQEALDFFGIEENRINEYFLIDHKTSMMLIMRINSKKNFICRKNSSSRSLC